MSSSEKVVNGFLWKFAERIGAQGVTLVVSIILARIIDPDAYGELAIVLVFTSILQVFVDSGLGTALIQKKDADDLDFSSVFIFNLFVCTLLYILLFFVSPIVAWFYKMPDLTKLLRVLGIILIISGVKNIQQAYVSRNMLFKRFFFSTLGGTIGAAIVGISLAILGYGVWALIGQYLFNALVDTLILWITVKWRPKWMFSSTRLKALLSFGWKLLGVSLFNTVYNNIRSLIIGKLYTSDDLAFYNRGQQYPQTISLNINVAIDSVLLPTMSQKQDMKDALKNMARSSIRIETYLIMPIMTGLAICADSLVRVLLTEKWIPCIPFIRVFCFVGAFLSVFTTDYNVFKAMGRSDIYLRVTVLSNIIDMSLLLTTMWFGVIWIACGVVLSSIVSLVICAIYTKKILDYSFKEQFRDLFPNSLLCVIMGITVYALKLLNINVYTTLILQIVVGILSYVLLSIVFKNESYKYVVKYIKDYINKNGKDDKDE